MIGNSNNVPKRPLSHWRQQQGLTLVETLITTAVVSIVFVVATQLLVVFFKSSTTSTDELFIQGNARQIISTVSERVREGFIDYEFYATPLLTPQQDQLALRDTNGMQSVYWFYTDSVSGVRALYLCTADQQTTCASVANPALDPDWEQVNPEGTDLMVGEFFITPPVSPFSSDLATRSDRAPLITMRLHLESDASVDSGLVQTSFTPRLYVR